MKKYLLALILFYLIFSSVSAQPGTDWIARYNGPSNGSDAANLMFVDSDGNVYVAGNSAGKKPNGKAGSQDYTVVKYNSLGTKLIEYRYDGTGMGADLLTGMHVDQAGLVYVTGRSWGAGYYDFATVVFNPGGTIKWVQRYDGNMHLHDWANDLEVDAAGNVYVTGHLNAVDVIEGWNGNAILTIKYSPSGNIIWSDVFNEIPDTYDGAASSRESGYSLVLSNDGSVYVTGTKGVSPGVITLKYDAAGVRSWQRTSEGSWGRKVMIDPLNNVVVASFYNLTKYTANGDLVWDITHEMSYGNMNMDGEGNIYLAGSTNVTVAQRDMLLKKFSEAGAQEWSRTHNGSLNNHDDANQVALDGLGNIYVTGMVSVPGARNTTVTSYATLAYDGEGNSIWPAAMLYDHADKLGSTAYAIGTFSDGQNVSVYVSGTSKTKSSNNDWATIKYSFTPAITARNIFEAGEQKLSLRNYPNPFRQHTTIEFSLEQDSPVTVNVFDLKGQLVSILLKGNKTKGTHFYSFHPQFPAGTYLLQLRAGNSVISRQMVRIQ